MNKDEKLKLVNQCIESFSTTYIECRRKRDELAVITTHPKATPRYVVYFESTFLTVEHNVGTEHIMITSQMIDVRLFDKNDAEYICRKFVNGLGEHPVMSEISKYYNLATIWCEQQLESIIELKKSIEDGNE